MDRFDAFISYSHAADGRLAPAVQSGLQRLARTTFQRRALRVFRDETGLSANPHLWGSIADALDASDWFVLLASPESAASAWVDREVTAWLEASSLDRLLVVVTDGTIAFDDGGRVDVDGTTCLPPSLLEVIEREPRWLDLRWARDETQLDLRNGRFRAAVADLAAPIHGVAKDELESEDVRQQRRTRRLAVTGLAIVAVLAVVAATTAAVAMQQRTRADDATEQAVARAVAAQAAATSTTDIDLALLLGVEGYRREQSIDTMSGLLAAVGQVGPVTQFVRTMPPRVVDLEVSPDRTTAYALTVDGSVYRVDTASWQTDETPVLTGLVHPWSLDVSTDGARLVANGSGGCTVVSLDTGEVLARDLGGATGAPTLDRDGSHLAVGLDAGEGDVEVFDVSSGAMTHRIDVSEAAAVFLPDGSLAVQQLGSSLLVVDALGPDGAVTELRRREGLVPGGGLALTPDGTRIVAGGLDGRAQVLDADTLETPAGMATVLSVRGSRTGDVFVNPSGTLIGLSSDDGSARVFDATTGAEVGEVGGLAGPVWSEFVSDDEVLSATYADDFAITWTPGSGTALGTTQVLGSPLYGLYPLGDGQAVYAIDGDVVVAPLDDLAARSVSRTIGTLDRTLAISADRTIVAAYVLQLDATGEEVTGRRIHVMRVDDLSDVTVITTTDDPVEHVAFDPTGSLLAVGYRDGRLAVFDVATGEMTRDPLDVDEFPCCLGGLRWSADGSRLYTGGQDGVLREWDTTTWEQLGEQDLAPDQSAIRFIHTFTNADGHDVMVVPTEAGSIFLIDAVTGAQIGTAFTVGGTQFQSGGIAQGGATLAVSSRDGKLRLWDIASGRPLGPPAPSGSGYTPILEVLDDEHVVTGGGEDGRVVVWELDPDDWARTACALVERNLTHEEWDRYVGGDYQRTCPDMPDGP